mgnify:CR=1 FL=1
MTDDTVNVTLETDGASEEIEVSATLVDMIAEEDEAPTAVVADLAVLGLAQQAHGVVHHGQGEVSDELAAAEELTMELFEDRFGQTYGEVTGHSH